MLKVAERGDTIFFSFLGKYHIERFTLVPEVFKLTRLIFATLIRLASVMNTQLHDGPTRPLLCAARRYIDKRR